MLTFPLHLSLEGKTVLIVGGGTVASRKVQSLLPSGATITIIAPSISHELQTLLSTSNLKAEERIYTSADLDGVFLVIAATNNHITNQQIANDCKAQGIMVSVVDNPTAGNCIFPALLQRGDLTISVSTAGKCPGYAAFIRDTIASSIGHKYGEILQQLAAEREKLLTDGKSRPYNSKILQSRINELLDNMTPSKEA